MSWLARSLANSLRLDDNEEDSSDDSASSLSVRCEEDMEALQSDNKINADSIGSQEALGRGVKEDLTELKQVLSRQLWGVANFLAPDPSSDSHSTFRDRALTDTHDPSTSREEDVSDAEVAGPPMLGLDDRGGSKESVATSEEEVESFQREVFGITEEALAFARNIAMHPETWLDFPLDEEDIMDDLEMSDAQQEHVFTIERLAPRLAALRIELCPCHMSASYFWLVYFVLLHSRLSKHDAELLYTSQVMEARAMWMRELHKQRKHSDEAWLGTSSSFVKDRPDVYDDYEDDRVLEYDQSMDHDTEKHITVTCNAEMCFVDKSVINEKLLVKGEDKEILSSPPKVISELEDDDGWLEEDSDLDSCYKTTLPLGNEEEISFSDLEEESTGPTPIKYNA